MASPSLPNTQQVFNENSFGLDQYLARIQYSKSVIASLETLKGIHVAHTSCIPFENLNPFLRRPVSLDIDSIQNKIIRQGRGGYCFEHNTLLAHALRKIGFSVKGLAARVLWNIPAGMKPARGHMLLLVTIQERKFIADTGFGGLTLPQPLEFVVSAEQQTSHETFRITESQEEYTLEVKLQNEWKSLYRFSTIEHFPSDYEVTNYYLSTNQSSHFLHNLLAARVAPHERFALRNNEFSIHSPNGPSEKRTLKSTKEIKELLSEVFYINLSDLHDLDQSLDKLLNICQV